MSAHTPGPWETAVNEQGQWDVCAPGGGDMIADLAGCDNAEANARIMAEAPALLAELRETELNLVQTRLANNVGRKSAARQVAFLLGQITRIEERIGALLARVDGRDQDRASDHAVQATEDATEAGQARWSETGRAR